MFVSNVCRNFHFVVWLAWKFQFHVLQNQIDILIYSYLCFCLESIHGIRRSVSADLCNFFHTCCQGGWIPICYPLFRILSGLFFPIKGSLFWLIIFVCLCEEIFFFRQRHPRKVWSLRYVLFGYLPGFWDVISPWLWIPVWREISRVVDWTSIVGFFDVKLQHIITCIPRCWRNCLRLEKTCDRCYLLGQLLALLLPIECLQPQEIASKPPKILLNIWIFWIARGKVF